MFIIVCCDVFKKVIDKLCELIACDEGCDKVFKCLDFSELDAKSFFKKVDCVVVITYKAENKRNKDACYNINADSTLDIFKKCCDRSDELFKCLLK